ncbi:MAG: hypothetical protein D6721_09090 [Gammaproteobacteria bacterium]|nr:MAG: hypothetical protein D6721_09090 [Gammaproteobacteria bacterium]
MATHAPSRLWSFRLLIVAALALLAVIYYTPIWWVALTAPNYPKEAFPEGVRIHFHLNGVFNGCHKVKGREIQEEEVLDCVHEMDTINHYVGMYPIAAGGVIEKAVSQFLVVFLAVMLAGFLCVRPRVRVAILGVGFAAVAAWMGLAWYGKGGIRFENKGYLEGLVHALTTDVEKESAEEQISSGMAVIEALKKSLAESGVKVEGYEPTPSPGKLETKDDLIQYLKDSFEADQARKPPSRRKAWTGSVRQVMAWHYEKTLGRYFNNPAEIRPMVRRMTTAGDVVYWAVVVAMVVLVVGNLVGARIFYWLLAFVPVLLPVFFVIEYSAWLWWYGHRLNKMGAFTVKPFMPTVFGDGKVAQFTTHSYPYYGFGLMLVFSGLLIAAMLVRRRILEEGGR